jgi:hypothetical protein
MTAGRLTKVAVFGLLCLAMISAVRAADEHTTLVSTQFDIHVQPGGFGRASPSDITAVLQSAAGELWRHCPHTQLAGIDVYHRADHPQTDFQRLPGGRIAIGLTTQDTYWAQYSFQFAHELCHALANYTSSPQQLVRYPRHANLWLEESLCETASLFTLRAMSRSWQTAPPYPAWRGYAAWLNSYAEQRLAPSQNYLPAGTLFTVWFGENQTALRQNATRRDRNTIIASQLLPIFETEPRGWETLVFLNIASVNPKQSLAQHLAQWRSQCPMELRPFVARLAALFAVKS